MNLAEPAIPCGLVAKSMFNDQFSNFFKVDQPDTEIKINSDGIAWETDRLHKFDNVKDVPADHKNPKTNTKKGEEWKNVQWIDMKNEHFIVWMRYAGLPTFRKLWGKLDQDLEPGAYKLTIQNEFDVSPFEGKKSIVFSSTNSLGGKSYKLATCFFVAGSCTALYLIFLAYKTFKVKQQ